ncbi:MAG: 16S rRNA processing protein RimM [Acidobacteria bacterium]|nr:16S rRNA processing protein RimM [Acidobacteriota bacterium]
MNSREQNLISIARIARPQGIHGEVIADLMTDFPERFAGLDRVTLRLSDGGMLTLRLLRHRMHKGRILLKFEGYDDIDRAEQLREATIVLDRAQLVALPEDNYFHFDLVDCRVVTVDGRELGTVTDVQEFGAAPLLVVRDQAERELLIPFTREVCPGVDITGKLITVDPPDGLLEL